MSEREGLLNTLLGSLSGGNIIQTVMNLLKSIWSMVKPMINALINTFRSFVESLFKGTFFEPIIKGFFNIISSFTAT
jgi:phage-related protein